jgi:hypothetical protein
LVEAKFVVITGRIDTMTVREFFICNKHADKLCEYNTSSSRHVIAGFTFDEWIMNTITEKAHDFYVRRAAERIAAAARNTGAVSRKAGNIPYSIAEPDPWRLQRGGWFYRNPREIREPVPFHGVCVGTGAALWNRPYRRA